LDSEDLSNWCWYFVEIFVH